MNHYIYNNNLLYNNNNNNLIIEENTNINSKNRLTSKLPIHSLDPINGCSLSFSVTSTSCIRLILGTDCPKFPFSIIHEHIVCNVLYPQPQP